MIEISLKPDVLGIFAGFPITNALLVSVLTTIVLCVIFMFVARRMKQVPGRLQLFVETFLTGSYEFVHGVTQNETVTKRMFPIFTTLLLFFLAANLTGFIPGLAALSFNDMPLYRSATSDYALIFVITMVMFIGWQLVAIVSGGLFGYVKKYINFSSPMDFVMGLLDIIGESAKIVSLSFRLFGNIFAGEVIATVMLVLMPYVAPVPFALLGLLSSVIQAAVFPILVLIFFNMAIVVKEEKQKEVLVAEGASTK